MSYNQRNNCITYEYKRLYRITLKVVCKITSIASNMLLNKAI